MTIRIYFFRHKNLVAGFESCRSTVQGPLPGTPRHWALKLESCGEHTVQSRHNEIAAGLPLRSPFSSDSLDRHLVSPTPKSTFTRLRGLRVDCSKRVLIGAGILNCVLFCNCSLGAGRGENAIILRLGISSGSMMSRRLSSHCTNLDVYPTAVHSISVRRNVQGLKETQTHRRELGTLSSYGRI